MDGTGELRVNGAAGFDKGRWPVRCLANRAGFWPAPGSPMWAIARVPLSIPTRPWNFPVDRGPKVSRLSRQSPGAGPGRSGSGSGSEGQGVEAAARAAPWGRLEAVENVLTAWPSLLSGTVPQTAPLSSQARAATLSETFRKGAPNG